MSGMRPYAMGSNRIMRNSCKGHLSNNYFGEQRTA